MFISIDPGVNDLIPKFIRMMQYPLQNTVLTATQYFLEKNTGLSLPEAKGTQAKKNRQIKRPFHADVFNVQNSFISSSSPF